MRFINEFSMNMRDTRFPPGGGCMVEHLISKAVGGSTMIQGGRVYGGALDIESSRGFHYDPGGGGCMVEHLISKAVGGSTMIPGPLLI